MAVSPSLQRALPLLLLIAIGVVVGVLVQGEGEPAEVEVGLMSAVLQKPPKNAPSSSDTQLPEPIAMQAARTVEPEPSGEGPAASVGGARERVPSKSKDIIVEVHDTNGKPLAGVPLLLNSTPPSGDLDRLLKDHDFAGFTDQDGRVTFQGAKVSARFVRPQFLYHCVAFEELPKVELTDELLTQEVIYSVQPPFGSIEVPVFEVTGEPAFALAEVFIELLEEEPLTESDLGRRRQPFYAQRSPGIATIPFVELGRSWMAATYKSGGDSNLKTWGRGRGPVRPGDTARIEVRFGSDRPIVKLRLVGAQGQVLPNQLVQVETSGTIYGTKSHQNATNAEGFLWIEVASEMLRHRPATLTLTADLAGASIKGKVGPLKDLKEGENDLGDLMLVGERVLLSGRVLDTAGGPIVGARVGLGRNVNYHNIEHDKLSGSRDGTQKTDTDESGAFEFRGLELPGHSKLWAYKDTEAGRSQSDVVPVDVPGAEINLALRKAFLPTAELLLPETSSERKFADRLRLTVTPADGARPTDLSSTSFRGGAENGIRYEFEGVFGGRFHVRCYFGDTLLMETRDVPVVEDGLLVRYDLREHLHVHRLVLEDPRAESGQAVEGKFRILEPAIPEPAGGDPGPALGGETETSQSYDFKGPIIEIVTIEDSINVRLLPTEYRAEQVDELRGEQRILLRPPLQIRLVLVTTGPLPEMPYRFGPQLFLGQDIIGKPIGTRWFTEVNRECVFALPTAGRVRVAWHLQKDMPGGGSISGGALYRNGIPIEVLERPGEQRFELRLDGNLLSELKENPPY